MNLRFIKEYSQCLLTKQVLPSNKRKARKIHCTCRRTLVLASPSHRWRIICILKYVVIVCVPTPTQLDSFHDGLLFCDV